jgi:hypothetical protein
MNSLRSFPCLLLLAWSLLGFTGCSKPEPAAAASPQPVKHEHKAPHGGTPVVLGNEAFHLELVRDAATGTLQAYVLDGEMENFIRTNAASLEIVATVNGAPQTLTLKPVANVATGETVGDTALFEAKADWQNTTAQFDAVLKSITLRGATFSDVKFNFPKGNDTDR